MSTNKMESTSLGDVAESMTVRLLTVRSRDARGRVRKRRRNSRPQLLSRTPLKLTPVRHGQPNLPGLYWSATTRGHIAYASRLERQRLVLADFDRRIVDIVARPWELEVLVDGAVSRIVPDFGFAVDDGSLVLCDVLPVSRATSERQLALSTHLTRELADLGVGYEVWSAPESRTLFANIEVLARYRNADLFDKAKYAMALEAVPPLATSVEEAERATGLVPAIARAFVMHMIWRHDLNADLSSPLHGGSSLLWGRP